MRCALFGIVVSCSAAMALAQAPGAGGFNQGGPGPGGPAGPGMMMGPPPNAMFSAIDVDGDGSINKTELRKAIVALKKLDTDGDGIITLAEVSPMGGPMGDPTQMIDRLMQGDKDGDGLLTAEELPGRMGARMIQDGDTSGDGALDRDELTAAMERARNQFRGGPGGFQNGQGGPGGFQGGPGGFRAGAGGANFDPAQMTGQIIQQYDKNGDNVLSADEVPRDARGKVKDLNGDGVIEAGELQAFTEQMGERMRANMGRARGRQNQNGAQPGAPGRQPNNP